MSTTQTPQTVSSPKSTPWLPPELVEQIIFELWANPQSPEERSVLFKTLCRVTHTWLDLFLRVALRDMHISCPLSAHDFLRLLPERVISQGEADVFTAEATSLLSKLCRSLTFHVEGSDSLTSADGSERAIKLYSQNDAAPTAISTVLYMVSTFAYLPHLRHVSLKYSDWGYSDLFDQLRLAVFPEQVTHLSLQYSFSMPAHVPVAVYLKSLYSRHQPPHFTIPTLRHLSLDGVPTEFAADMLQICTQVETLEITNPTRLYVLTPLPKSVHTLVLRMPGVTLHREQMHWWMLIAAMEGKLFDPDVGGRIVVRAGTPEPVVWTDTKRFCKKFGVELVYERDDYPCGP